LSKRKNQTQFAIDERLTTPFDASVTVDAAQAPPQAPQRNRFVLILLKLSAMAIGVLVALLIGELIVRIFVPQPKSWLDIFARSEAPPFTLQPNVTRSLSTGESTWSIYTDDRGFRSAKSPTHTNAPNLLILGDSFPFGMGVNYEDSIPGRLDAALAGKYHILNSGVPSYGPTQYRQVLERELKKRTPIASVIAFTYMGNDWHDCIWKKTGNVRDGILNNERSVRSFVKQNFHLYRLATNTLHKLRHDDIETFAHERQLYVASNWDTTLKSAHDIYREEFATMRDLCAQSNIPFAVVIMPTAQAVDKPDSDAAIPIRKAREIFESLGIAYVDITPALAKAGLNQTFFTWDTHLNPTGNKVAADAILAGWIMNSSQSKQ
jgi:hypothetical protein